ncbi:MAG: hypothetical protein JXB08_05610 [Bacilli bacterium]|nr:hypothetical protein [Bacilli bacterium]MBN2877491.1 hypothetical protein [Bacilli bacterium]
MAWWNYVLIIYGIFCLYIGLLKPPFIWNLKKIEIMKKMFKGDLGVQILVLVFGVAALVLGIVL